MRDRYDVVVAGGGPGGSTIASLLAQRGRSVLVLERDEFPRFHVGESLLPMSLEVFDAIGVTPKLESRLLRKYGARFVRRDGAEEVAFAFDDALRPLHGYAFQGPRAEIDAILLDHAAELGAEVRQRTEAMRAIEENGRVVGVVARGPEGDEREVRATVVVDATGRDGLLRRGPGARRKLAALERTFAVFTQLDGCARLAGRAEGDVRIVLVEEGWFWVIPFRGDRGSAGIALDPDRLARGDDGRPDLDKTLFDRIAACAPMADVVRGARQVFPARATADFSYRVTDIVGDGWLAIGDAAGFIDPLFSTGLHLAVKGADIAAPLVDRAVEDGDASHARWERYERAMRFASETYVGAVQAFYRGDLVELLFAAKKRPFLRRAVTSLLAGDVFHDEVPRWLAMLRERFPARST